MPDREAGMDSRAAREIQIQHSLSKVFHLEVSGQMLVQYKAAPVRRKNHLTVRLEYGHRQLHEFAVIPQDIEIPFSRLGVGVSWRVEEDEVELRQVVARGALCEPLPTVGLDDSVFEFVRIVQFEVA